MSLDTLSARHTCIFLGAGSSAALFSVPIQSHLIEALLSWDAPNESHPHLSQHLRRMLSTVGDIELVLSHYHNLAYPKKVGRNSGIVREFMLLRVALAQYMDDIVAANWYECAPLAENLLRRFFAERSLESSNFFVVTTNYDIAFETLLDEIFGSGSCWYSGLSEEGRSDGIPIFKLHGSINWMEDRGRVSRGSFSRSSKPIIIAPPSQMKLTEQPGNSGYFFEQASKKYTPVIVPFVFQKDAWLKEDNSDWEQIFNTTWTRAVDLMNRSKEILFWGYGLPAADYQMFSILVKVLERSEIYFEVVDKARADTTMLRLGKLFSERSKIFDMGLVRYLESEQRRK
jgi:SIR2-like domain